MRISDWSSDVCSSDLPERPQRLSSVHDELGATAGGAPPDGNGIATLEGGEFRAPRRQSDRWFSVRHDKVQSKWMRRGPPSGADAFDREPEGITVFEHDMNMRGIDPGAGRDACDISLRAKCLGDDVQRALVRTAPGVLAFVDMRLDQFGKERGHRRKARRSEEHTSELQSLMRI